MADNDLIPPQIANGGAGSVQVGGVRAPDYRQLQEPAEPLSPWRLPNNDAAARAEELGNVFKEVGTGVRQLSDTFLEPKARQAGATAGAAAGLDPNFTPKTGLQAATAYGQEYNHAAAQTYITSTQLSLEQQLSQIEQQNPSNPVAFQTQAGAAVKGALDKMDPLFAPEMTNWAQARIQAGVNRQRDQAIQDTRNESLATYQNAVDPLITSALHTAGALPGAQGDAVIAKLISDDKDKLNALVASRVITAEQANTMHARFADNVNGQMSGQKVDLSLQPVLSAMRTNVESADKLILQDDPNLTPAENAARLQEFEKDREQYAKTQTLARASDLASVHQQLANGDTGPELEQTIHGLYKAGAMTEEGYFSALAESVRNQRKQVDDTADMQLIDQIVHGERQGPLDPKDGAQAAAVDKYFQAHIGLSGANISPEQYASGAAEIFRQTGILPASVQSRIRIGLMSQDPQRAVEAASLALRVQKVNPTADAFVQNPKLAALATLINSNRLAGMPGPQAYQLAVQTTEIPTEQRKLRDADYGKALKAQGPNAVALQAALNKATPGIFSHAPPAPVAMQAEYDGLVREFYNQTGDLGTARSIAATQLRQTWGVSKVNGNAELMKYPISDALAPTVRSDIASSAKAAGYTGDPSAIHLTPGPYTDSSGGRVWMLTHVDPQSGLTDVLLDKSNRPLQYQLPSAQQFAQARQTLIDQKLDAARKQRDFERANAAEQIKFERELANEYLTK